MFSYIACASVLLCLNISGSISQLRTTYLHKRAENLSLLSVALFTAGLWYSVLFAFGTEMEWPYRIAFPCQAVLIFAQFILIYRYSKEKRARKRAIALLMVIMALPVFFLGFSTFVLNNAQGARTAGWIRSAILLVRCIPQLIHTGRHKSVIGISSYKMTAAFCSSIAHLFLSIVFGHDLSAVVNNIRMVAIETLSLAQFGYYSYHEKKAAQK